MVWRVGVDVPTEDFVPSWVFGAIDISGSLVHRVSNTHTTIRIHASEPIVLIQLCLGRWKSNNEYIYWFKQSKQWLLGSGRVAY